MKVARCILKLVAVLMVAAAVVCAVVAYWDRIVDAFYAITDRLEQKKADCRFASEYDDYEDCAL